MLQEIHELYAKCKNLDNIEQQKREIVHKINEITNEQKTSSAAIEKEIEAFEERINQINREIATFSQQKKNEFGIEKARIENNFYLRFKKDILVVFEDESEEFIKNKFQIIEKCKRIEFFEGADDFYIQLSDIDENLQEIDSAFEKNLNVSINDLRQSRSIFNLKIKSTRVLYNLILRMNKIDIFSGDFAKKVNEFNDYFFTSKFYKIDLIELEIKIILTEMKELIKKRKFFHMNEETRTSFEIQDFLKILKLLQNYKNESVNKTQLINSNKKQAVKNFFKKNRTNSLREKILTFSDACFFVKNYKNEEEFDFNQIQEESLNDIFEFIEIPFGNEDFQILTKQIISSFNDIVDQIFIDHRNMSLKSILKDRIYQWFIDYILSFEQIREYDAYDLTKISEVLFNLGVERLENFSQLFFTRKNKNLDISDEDFDLIVNKMIY